MKAKKSVIIKYPSEINREIEVVKGNGGYSLLVDNITQSGPDIEALWGEAFEKLLPNVKIRNTLILGFGAGSIVNLIRERWPQSLINGVEIDPVMVEIAQKYFPKNLERVNITTGDAFSYINERSDSKQTFDLIIVDCYLGDKDPENLKTIQFLVKLKQIGKNVLINQLFLPNMKSELEKIKFLRDLDHLYPCRVIKLPYNIIIAY